MTAVEIASLIKDALVGIAATVTSSVAIVGLKSWSRELRGKAAFDVARELAKATYRLRDEVEACRSAFISVSEFPSVDPYQARSAEQRANDFSHAYANRWNKVIAALQEFDASTLEAEALWGTPIREITNEFRSCLGELWAAIEAYIDDARSGGSIFKADLGFGKMIKVKVWSTERSTNDFTKRLEMIVSRIDYFLLPHLRRA